MIFGSVRWLGDAGPVPHARLIAEWIEPESGSLRWMERQSGADGGFRFCGIPVGRTVVVRAATDSGSAEPVAAAVAASRRFARADLEVDPNLPPTASFVGTVVTDTSAPRPLDGVEVAIPSIAKSLRTDARGQFRLFGIPPGRHAVVIRKIGYGTAVDSISFVANDMVRRQVVLTAMTTLDPVVVMSERNDRFMKAFDERRRLGLGQFITRDDLARSGAASVPAVLSQLRGIKMVRTGTTRAYIGSSRGRKSLNCPSVEYEDLTRSEPVRDPSCCYAAVYLDRMPLYRGGAGVVPNVWRLLPDNIEAIEYYAGPAQTPAEYADLNSTCGVVVIHTRRPESRRQEH
jgi:hypothetical protein